MPHVMQVGDREIPLQVAHGDDPARLGAVKGYFALLGEDRSPGGTEHPVGTRGLEPGDLARRRETVAAMG